MLSLFYPEYGKLVVNEQPVPLIERNEVLVKVSACGICGSELETFARRSNRRVPPKIMGHEFCGMVETVGSQVKNIHSGMQVVSNSIVSCGECSPCQRGEANLCQNRQVFGMHRAGAFAEYVNVPAHCLIPMDDKVDPRAACLTEPLANGVHMVNLTRHLPLNQVLIFGAGPIGLMAQQAFQTLRNAEVIVADLKPERLDIAKMLGAKHVIHSGAENLEVLIEAYTSGNGVDVVIDAVGRKETNSLGLKLLRSGGTLLLIGLHENSTPFNSYDIILSEKKVTGSYAATQEDMKTALGLISDNKVNVTSWVDYFPLSDSAAAFTGLLSSENTCVKAVLLM